MKRITHIIGSVALCTAALLSGGTMAASHREAPLIANDPTADNTDFYMFRSWVNPANVVFILNTIPVQEPSGGPNYFNFGDDVLYKINVDTNADGKEDLTYEIRFTTEIRDPLQLPLGYVALPPITALTGPGSEGILLRQSYKVTQVRGHSRIDLGTQTMYAVPSRVGPLTMPNYEALAAQGIYALANGGKVFAGQRDESFYIDLGGAFDTLNLRRTPPILSAAEDADDSVNPFGNDTLSGFNISTIAIEVPITTITGDVNSVIGAYVSTERQKVRIDRSQQNRPAVNAGPGVQLSRMGNPLVNELIIGTNRKDEWNSVDPSDEARFLDFYLNSRLALAMNVRFGTNFPTTNRTDLVNALLNLVFGELLLLPESHRDIVADGERIEERGELENVPDARAELVELAPPQLGHLESVDDDLAGVRLEQTDDMLDRDRLPRARVADDDHRLAFSNIKREALFLKAACA